MAYVLRAQRHVAIGIWVHVLLNSIGTLGLVAVMLARTDGADRHDLVAPAPSGRRDAHRNAHETTVA
jgi:hypothetical protein